MVVGMLSGKPSGLVSEVSLAKLLPAPWKVMFTPGLKLSRAACHGDMVVACPRDDDVAAPADRDVVVLAAESDGVGAVADRNVRPAGRPEDGEIGVTAVDRCCQDR
jgi:hypothetical protein